MVVHNTRRHKAAEVVQWIERNSAEMVSLPSHFFVGVQCRLMAMEEDEEEHNQELVSPRLCRGDSPRFDRVKR